MRDLRGIPPKTCIKSWNLDAISYTTSYIGNNKNTLETAEDFICISIGTKQIETNVSVNLSIGHFVCLSIGKY